MNRTRRLAPCAFWCFLLLTSASKAGDFRWGAVGHSNWINFGPNFSYNRVPIEKQMSLLNQAGLTWYRTSCVVTNCAELTRSAAKHKIQILKSSGGTPDGSISESENYSRAFAMAAADAKLNPTFKYYEAGNEIENWVGAKGDGSAKSQYNAVRYAQARGYIKGLMDGIRSATPSAKVLVDDSGWCHYGFLQSLWEDGIRWDITAFHWYSNQGDFERAACGNNANVAAMHAAFGLPIWITEFNSKDAATRGDRDAEAAWIAEFIRHLHSVAPKYSIEAAFIYELIDEPNRPGAEGHYGIYDGDGNSKGSPEVILKVLSELANPR